MDFAEKTEREKEGERRSERERLFAPESSSDKKAGSRGEQKLFLFGFPKTRRERERGREREVNGREGK